MMERTREKISLAILGLVFVACSLRYFPGQPGSTFFATAEHLLVLAPFLVGAVLIFNSFFQRQSGERPSFAKMLRVALTLGIIIELFIGLSHYLTIDN